MFTFFGSIISSERPPLFPSNGNAGLDLIISAAFAFPLIRKSAVFVASLAPPDGKPATSLKLLTVRGSLDAFREKAIFQEKITRFIIREPCSTTPFLRFFGTSPVELVVCNIIKPFVYSYRINTVTYIFINKFFVANNY